MSGEKVNLPRALNLKPGQNPQQTVSGEKRLALEGCGLGFRRDLMGELESHSGDDIDFLEVAPENWIGVGGAPGKRFRRFTERYPFVCHGLSLSLGGPAPLDTRLLKDIKTFLDEYRIRGYSEHLSYCSDDGHLYDLMPIPFTPEAADYVAKRIERTQELLGRRIAIENTSAYVAPGQEMSEPEFINRVLEKADCALLLDVNNVYVNSVNFDFDPVAYLQRIPGDRIAYCHIAGHSREGDDLIVDTHGADVIPPVWRLLDKAYELFGVIPTLLERDYNFPEFGKLRRELGMIAACQRRHRSDTRQKRTSSAAPTTHASA